MPLELSIPINNLADDAMLSTFSPPPVPTSSRMSDDLHLSFTSP